MKIEELAGKRVKVSAHSLTVKDEDDKTRGVVRSVTSWHDAPFREQVELNTVLKKHGAKADFRGFYDGFFLAAGKWFYLINSRTASADHEDAYKALETVVPVIRCGSIQRCTAC